MKEKTCFRKKLTVLIGVPLVFLLFTVSKPESLSPMARIGSRYIRAWTDFYPSEAFAMGHRASAFRLENLSRDRINGWIDTNRGFLEKLDSLSPFDDFDERMDARLLKRKMVSELEKWDRDRVDRNSPSLYAGLISQALTHVLVSKDLSEPEKGKAVSSRLTGIQRLCGTALKTLRGGRPSITKRAIHTLEDTAGFFRSRLPEMMAVKGYVDKLADFRTMCQGTASAIDKLTAHLKNTFQRRSKNSDSLGKTKYARKLKLYTGTELTPEKLEELAMAEIDRVRKLMEELAASYWKETTPEKRIPTCFDTLMGKALADMEDNREHSQAAFLHRFKKLIHRAEAFVREKRLAPLPRRRTLLVDLSPSHFSGARVGGVYPAGPFNPDADTLFYLPTIPDTAPEKDRENFYRSFNNHFNTMIITHEIVPGHYLHLKTAARHPRMIRPLFGGDLYAEGWATLCEQITLDRGWDNDHPLTRLAHLRKRLENAVRAYTSVQVHCRQWNRDRLIDFAVNTGMLPPQFAVNLWHRVIHSPFQLTAYFLGFRAFQDILESQKKKKGPEFSLFDFSNTILEAGFIPLDGLPALFRNRR